MSQLRSAILPAIAATDLAVAGIYARAVWGDTLPGAAEEADLPLRVLSSYSSRQTGTLRRFTTLAGNRVVDWTIEDLLLVRAAGSGSGPADLADALAAYQEDYEAILHTLRDVQWTTIGAEFAPDVYEWPEGSGRQYDGVRVRLTVRELR